MIVRAIDRIRFAFEFAGEAAKIGVEFSLNLGSDESNASLGAENEMREQMSICSAHRFLIHDIIPRCSG